MRIVLVRALLVCIFVLIPYGLALLYWSDMIHGDIASVLFVTLWGLVSIGVLTIIFGSPISEETTHGYAYLTRNEAFRGGPRVMLGYLVARFMTVLHLAAPLFVVAGKEWMEVEPLHLLGLLIAGFVAFPLSVVGLHQHPPFHLW